MNSKPGQPTASSPGRWWHGAVLYHLYVRSWRDTNRDGYGDLEGVISGLDYLAWLGVDGVWLSPTMPSPDHDWGYDVSDYLGVHPELGTLADMDKLIAEAGRRGLRVLLDLVPNHTSSEHAWFIDAASGRDAGHRDFYVWADPAMKGEGEVGGGPPNNWLNSTGACAWTWHEPTGQFYLHNFLPEQPDLNWWEPRVHEAFADILRFWLDRGVAGFRIDVANGLYKDAKLRDNPPASVEGPMTGRHGQLAEYNLNRPEVHGVYRDWRRIADSYADERLLLGETWVDTDQLGSFYGHDDELQLGFNFPFVFAGLCAPTLSGVVAQTLAKLPASACPVWTSSNHDVGRFPSRWCDGDEPRIRLALLVLATLPGTTVLYYGDEIGMTDVRVPLELQRDAMSRGTAEGWQGNRDRARTPMQWDGTASAGFADADVTPWLPVGDSAAVNVASQRDDPASVLHLCRALLRLRQAELGGQLAEYQALPAPPEVWAYRIGPLTVAGNFSGHPVGYAHPGGTVLLSTSGPGGEAGGTAGGTIELGPWQGLILRTEP
ncbi:MAG TPA: alpha-amylase family glycosyl hydrolase [Streptosporangiaceae bacterium]|jgi:alpha-glucosidase|nr:alpha-amylase family glycosyl hydrolase [Streptosporangiaceae bacterium]